MTFPYLDETHELNEITRKEANGSFIQLTDGVTHYELGGPQNGSPVVFVHGFSGPYFIFDTTFEFLSKVLAFESCAMISSGAGIQTGLAPGTTSTSSCVNSRSC